MRKIVALEFMTLDGVIQGPGDVKEDREAGFKYGGWMGPYFNEASGKEMENQMKGKYDLLLGRKTYDIFAGYWPDHAEGWPQVNKITKYVVSRTLKKPTWENTVVIKNINELKKLRNSTGVDLQVYGSSKLMQTLFKNDLVDELWLKIFPITLGKGKKLWGEGVVPAAFKLIKFKVTPPGVIFANYKRAGTVKTKSVDA